jgi:hypothetical protein
VTTTRLASALGVILIGGCLAGCGRSPSTAGTNAQPETAVELILDAPQDWRDKHSVTVEWEGRSLPLPVTLRGTQESSVVVGVGARGAEADCIVVDLGGKKGLVSVHPADRLGLRRVTTGGSPAPAGSAGSLVTTVYIGPNALGATAGEARRSSTQP